MSVPIDGQGKFHSEFGNTLVRRIDGSNALQVDANITTSESVVIANAQIGTFKNTRMWVGITPLQLPTTPLIRRVSVNVYVNSMSDVYIGQSSVTIDNGTPVRGYKRAAFDAYGPLYGITGSESVEVRVLEGGI